MTDEFLSERLHGLALDYRTAATYGEAQVAWARLEARVLNMVEDARLAALEEAAKIAEAEDDYRGHGDAIAANIRELAKQGVPQ